MIDKPLPTRAEVNDVVSSLTSGASGLVLAAETAIGRFPVECVRMISDLINEVEKKPEKISTGYLLNHFTTKINEPHGGKLISLTINEDNIQKNNFSLTVNNSVESDVNQICKGVYSPLNRFMNLDEVRSVLDSNALRDNNTWTLPIIFQINEERIKEIPHQGKINLKSNITHEIFAEFEVEKIEKIDSDLILKSWFGTTNHNHPGVSNFISNGNFILSGKPYLLNKGNSLGKNNHELTPAQSRTIFSQLGWKRIIGFHTRNIPHAGHQYIQLEALKKINADGIFISPVVGGKKTGDFTPYSIIKSYEHLISINHFSPFGVVIGGFNSYSRYSGPREAVFTAICRKNFGCSHFIVGRDHTGIADHYDKTASQNIFEELELNIEIIKFDEAAYCKKRKIITNDFTENDFKKNSVSISGSKIREMIEKNEEIPNYLLNKSISGELKKLYKKDPDIIFVK